MNLSGFVDGALNCFFDMAGGLLRGALGFLGGTFGLHVTIVGRVTNDLAVPSAPFYNPCNPLSFQSI
jgi:hypothetical protein